MRKSVFVVGLVALLAAPFVMAHLPGLRRYERVAPATCEGRFEGRWRLLASEREKYPDLTDGCNRLEVIIEAEYEPTAGNACPALWGTISVDGSTRNFHSVMWDLVFNDGDSFVTDPSGQNEPLSVMVWAQKYSLLPKLLWLVAPLREEADRLEVSGYIGGQRGSLMYERER